MNIGSFFLAMTLIFWGFGLLAWLVELVVRAGSPKNRIY